MLSQKEEGWRLLPSRYDDGGFSGGTLDRPSLRRLLADVERGHVRVIVVYKVDRLTRSLTDFARIVETLDAKGVSFVSVTQQFNTTTSMGRLTLNVLLSFAQFEREVTGERIRDKIAASKRKGIWMGGWVPLGYSLEARKLLVEPKEAALVRKIFSLYHELGCVSKLAARLEFEEMRSKAWLTKSGTRLGGKPFSRGALYELLQNRLYLGEIRHREQWFAGEHQPIVSRELWEKVQGQLKSNRRKRRSHIREQSSSLLTGLLFDARGNRYTPSFTIRRGRRYRYYVSQLAIKTPGRDQDGLIRLPAREIENMVTERLLIFLRSDAEVFDGLSVTGEKPSDKARRTRAAKKLATKWPTLGLNDLKDLLESFVEQVIIRENNIQLRINRTNLRHALRTDNFPPANPEPERTSGKADDALCLLIDAKFKQSGAEVHLVVPPNPSTHTSRPNASLVKAIASARGWYAQVLEGKFVDQTSLARSAGKTQRYISRVFACAFLAPDIVEAILEGRQPRDLTFRKLSHDIPGSWVEQREKLGFPSFLSSQSYNEISLPVLI